MIVKLPVIGLPNYKWKKMAVKFVRNNPNIIRLKVEDLCYECERHRELLRMFDNGLTNYENSRSKSGKIKEVALKKIRKFQELYSSMKEGIYECPRNRIPIITEDGCRLDGSHKLTILEHIGCKEADVNIVIYRKIFSESETRKILKDNIKYRKKTYNL